MTSLTRWATDAAASLPSIVVVRAMMVASRCWLSEPDPLDGDESQRRLTARRIPLCKKGTTATTFGSPCVLPPVTKYGDGFPAAAAIVRSSRSGLCVAEKAKRALVGHTLKEMVNQPVKHG